VILGLASLRPSRVPSLRNVLERRRLPIHPLQCPRWASAITQGVPSAKVEPMARDGVGVRCAANACAVPPLESGMQTIQSSPYRSGVAGPQHTHLLLFPAFPTCSCPLALSGLGELFASESLTLNSGHLWWQFLPCVTRRTLSPHTAHERRNVYGKFLFRQLQGIPPGQLAHSLTTSVPLPDLLPKGLRHVRGFPALRLLCPI